MDCGEVSIETMRDRIYIGMYCLSHDTKWGESMKSNRAGFKLGKLASSGQAVLTARTNLPPPTLASFSSVVTPLPKAIVWTRSLPFLWSPTMA